MRISFHGAILGKRFHANFQKTEFHQLKKFPAFKSRNYDPSHTFPHTLVLSERHATDARGKAELFNDYFVSVVTDVNYEIFEPTASQLTGNIKLEISKEMLERELRLINASKSRGPDNLQPVIFRETSYSLSKSLKLLFDNIIRLAKFPEAWKHGLVSPIYKDGRKSDVTNYRPVTLLSIASKIMGKFISNIIMNCLLPLVSENQYGFLPRRSVVNQLIRSLSRIYENIGAASDYTCLLLFDFSKAFDTKKH